MNDVVAGYRKMAGKSQSEMAKALNISTNTYRNKELGKSEFNSKEMFNFLKLVKLKKPDVTLEDIFLSEEV
ncbi:helix-turn-helix transcriptional regulator [Facklamia sp. P12955]|uniref:helix-turn-helix transcriptional regulator n=1 Tax=Facklamia sp. P12955 TaxID=3421946 RepID=UPI003D17C987